MTKWCDETFKGIEKALGGEERDYDFRSCVAKCFGIRPPIFTEAYSTLKLTPRPRAVKKSLRKIEVAARQLEDALVILDSFALGSLPFIGRYLGLDA